VPPLVDIGFLKEWAPNRGLDSAKDPVLNACLDAASAYVESETSRVFQSDARAVKLDGNAADGRFLDVLRLPSGHRPVTAIGSVTENGIVLVAAEGYTATADVIIDGLNAGACRLIRRGATQGLDQSYYRVGAWAPGVQNIAVSYTAGPATVPSDIQIVACEAAWLAFRAGHHVGLSSKAAGGRAATFTGQLSEWAKQVLARYRVVA